jgi:hypothetical protein
MEILSEFMRPFIERRRDVISDKTYLQRIIEIGCQKAVEVAHGTMIKIREALKF